MDARTSKRIEDLEHIRAKKHFRSELPPPDPYDRSVSTRFWKYSLRCWDKAMQSQYDRGEQPDVRSVPCYLLRVPLSPGTGAHTDESSPPGSDRAPLQRVFKEPYVHSATNELSGEEALKGEVHIKMLES